MNILFERLFISDQSLNLGGNQIQKCIHLFGIIAPQPAFELLLLDIERCEFHFEETSKHHSKIATRLRPCHSEPMIDEAIARMRVDYAGRPLEMGDVGPDPVAATRRWLEEAVEVEVKDANAMTLATVDEAGAPDARIVLIKGIENGLFVFYTNYESNKGLQLAHNPRASLVFYWAELERQIRVWGTVAKVARSSSEAYFRSRPRGSQVGAWASAQSRPLASRAAIEAKVAELEARFGEAEVPVPGHWGGYALSPVAIELWQGRPNRLHDRLRATRTGQDWTWERLNP